LADEAADVAVAAAEASLAENPPPEPSSEPEEPGEPDEPGPELTVAPDHPPEC
jgi:hypothetical protein